MDAEMHCPVCDTLVIMAAKAAKGNPTCPGCQTEFDILGEPDMTTYPEFQSAFVGILNRCGSPPTACYDRGKIIAHLMAGGCNEEEAEEYVEYNIAGGYVGEDTPYLLTPT